MIGVVLLFLFFNSKDTNNQDVVSGTMIQQIDNVNKGVKMNLYIVDKDGNILEKVGSKKALSIVSVPDQTGFLNIDNVNTFLALSITPDNSLGISEVTLNSISGSNPCANGNPLYGTAPCTGITNIFGGTGTGTGDLLSKFTFPLVLSPRGLGAEVLSNGMNMLSLELATVDNIINFTATMTGTFKNEFGADIVISPPPFGSVVLKILPAVCSGGTSADLNSTDADVKNPYCQQSGGDFTGKYCRIDAFGDPVLTNRASLCGCPTGQIRDGEVCVASNCAVGTCSGVTYCVDGTNIETRCQECTGGVLAEIQSRCPLAGGQQATSCNPAAPGISQCVYPPSLDPVSWWKFDGNFLDSIGGNNGAIFGNPIFITGVRGQALSYDGIDDSVSVLHDESLNPGSGDFAIVVWAKLRGCIDCDIMRKGSSATVPVGGTWYKLEVSPEQTGSNRLSLNFNTGTGFDSGTVTTTERYDDLRWHFFVAQRVGGTAELWVDGVRKGTDTVSGTISNTANLAIGSKDTLNDDFFNGDIDEVRFFNRALTSTEIQNLYTTEAPPSCFDGILNQDETCTDVGGVCGGFESGVELTCTDSRDNDCDGLIDSLDTIDCALVPIQFTKRVLVSTDDAEECVADTTMDLTSTDLELGEEQTPGSCDPVGNDYQWVGVRFTGVSIPFGATITNAYIEFEIDFQQTVGTNLNIYGQATDNPATFTSLNAQISGRARTTNFVVWNSVANLAVDAKLQSPNINPIIQEIINRPGWASGNSMVFIINGTGVREVETFNGEPAAAPYLVVNYTI